MTPPDKLKSDGMHCRKLGTEVMCDDLTSVSRSAAAEIGLGIGEALWGVIEAPTHVLKRITGVDSYLGEGRAWSFRNLGRAYRWNLQGNPLFIVGDTANHIFYGGLNTLTAGLTHTIFNQWLGLNIQYFTPPPKTIRESARVVSGGILVAMPLKGVVLNKMGIKATPTLEVISEPAQIAKTDSATASATEALTSHLNFSKVARADRIQPRTPSDIYDGYQNIPPGIWNSHPQLKVGPGSVPPLPRTVETSLGKVEIPDGSMAVIEASTGNIGGSGSSGASGALGVSNSGSGGTTFVLAPTEVKTPAMNRTSAASEVAAENSPSVLPSIKIELIPGNTSQLPMTLPSAFHGDMVEKKSSDEFIVVPGTENPIPMFDPLTPEEQQGPIGDSAIDGDFYYSMSEADGSNKKDELSGIPKEVVQEAEEESPIPEPVELEKSLLKPVEIFDLLVRENDRIAARFDSIISGLSEEVRVGYEKEFQQIAHRIQFWKEEIGHLERYRGVEKERYAEDIAIGERLLLDRVLRLGAAIFSEPIEEGSLSDLGLRSPHHRPIILRPKYEPSEKPIKEIRKIIPALVNRDIGYGKALEVRPHQEIPIAKIKGRLRLIKDQLENSATNLPIEVLAGTIIMPVGSGKTRTMMASFAAAIEEGVFIEARGDKFIILNHTDQIHQQNLEEIQRLAGYFEKQFGRKLKISEYKAENKDLSGDVVVVSVPSVNNEERRVKFERELYSALGEQGKIVMVGVDEVHHLTMSGGKGEESWAKLLETLRTVSHNFLRLGFTATPAMGERSVLHRMTEREAMQLGITPRTYLVKVEGEDLSQLKVTKSSQDFVTRELVSTLLDKPQRNERLYQALEKHGIRKEKLSPSGKNQLEAVLGFGVDLQHAKMKAEDYAKYFSRNNGGDLKNRRIIILGKEKGKISQKELEAALTTYRKGEADAVIVVVSGYTEGQKDPILEAVTQGEIEAVFTVDALVEGADLWMFSHQLGGRPTFSRIKKGQERGRTNRRGPNDVTSKGKLLNDRPKILFDIIDTYYSHEQNLIEYGAVMGATGHAAVPKGEIYDGMTGKTVEKVDLEGKGINHLSVGEIEDGKREKTKLPPQTDPASPWLPMIEKLKEILAENYNNDLELMALDLGEPAEHIERFFKGEGWHRFHWFLKRLATLLYKERDTLLRVYNEHQRLNDEKVTNQDYVLLEEGLAIFAEWEGKNPEIDGIKVLRETEEPLEIVPYTITRIYRRKLTDIAWREAWKGLTWYFENKQQDKTLKHSIRKEAGKQYLKLMQYLYRRENWEEKVRNKYEALRWHTRRLVALKFGGKLPNRAGIEGVSTQSAKALLTQWLKVEKLQYTRYNISSPLYSQIEAFLKGLRVEERVIHEWIKLAVFHEQNWPTEASNPQEELLLNTRRLIALKFGGELPQRSGIVGVSFQSPDSPLTRWLKGEKIQYTRASTPAGLYSQIEALLKGLGIEEKVIHEWIQLAVFHEQNWPTKASNPQEELLLNTRRLVALNFGGELPSRIGIIGVSDQRGNTPLTRWLNGEKLKYSTSNTPTSLYSQVEALLKGLGVEEKGIHEWIQLAVFHEQNWPTEASNPQEELLLNTRKLIALKFGGELPKQSGIPGVPDQYPKATLTRWIKGENLQYSTKSMSASLYASLYSQIKALLKGLGVEEKMIREWIKLAVFYEKNWPTEASNPQEELLLNTRMIIASEFGGELPNQSGITGLPQQTAKTFPLRPWLSEGRIGHYSSHNTPATFYSQINSLLRGLGLEEKLIQSWIILAVFHERNWPTEASNPQEELLLNTHKLIALKFGGKLPFQTGIPGVPQLAAQAPITRWLKGKKVPLTSILLDQIRALLIGLDKTPEEVDKLMEGVKKE